ncbi:response regulator transcription factor [Flavobacterium sp. SUN046]|uniref:response regulator transcription factor n=1 Tax=Flavobacterium sp. SUN046 TaxID=3002440 RepID=UPI002DBE773C|nr:response regulator transcription factor [Flavobacterium sp. SUN046]MEC4050216.1 response regulator transcription factor [Flavobacterium sp. SUN046]
MRVIELCIIDDHKIVRQGLKFLLESSGNFIVTHEFENGVDFLNAIPLDPPPDLYILDESMPHLSGIEVLQSLEQRELNYLVLLLTQHFEEDIIAAAYQHGARGFLNKSCTAEDLTMVIENIVNNGYHNITDILTHIKRNNYFPRVTTKGKKIELSSRELEFLRHVCDQRELTYEEIAGLMKVSEKTVDGYRSSIFDRYKIKSKVGLVLFSFKYKLTKPFL